jgi:AGZA family xanthine/uracil permease-like MFS transporter
LPLRSFPWIFACGFLPISGLIALERGFIFTSMILAALTVCLIEKHYRQAAVWAMVAAGISATGLMHGYRLAEGAIVNAYGPETTWPFVLGYAGMAVVFFSLDAWKNRPVKRSRYH